MNSSSPRCGDDEFILIYLTISLVIKAGAEILDYLPS